MHFLLKYLWAFTFTTVLAFSQTSLKTHFTIALDPDYSPFTFKNSEGKAEGLLVDLWNLWAQENSYTVEYHFSDWDETLAAVKSGKIDFHSGTTLDYDWMNASQPIYSVKSALYTNYHSSIIEQKDLLHKQIGTIDASYGEVAQKACQNLCTISTYRTYDELLSALEHKEVDVIIDDVDALTYYFINHGVLSQYKQIEAIPLHHDSTIYAITNHTNRAMLEQINKGLKKILPSKLIDIDKRWFPNVSNTYYQRIFAEKEENNSYLLYGFIVALFFIGVLGIYMYRLHHMHVKAKEDALHDGLTGIYNKRAFEEFFHKDAKSVGLIFIDVDFFKEYNDTYGHVKGDTFLKKVGEVLKEYKNTKCIPFRVGGDEFVVLVYDKVPENIEILCQEILVDIRNLKIEHNKNPIGLATATLGASYGSVKTDKESLYHCADEALYEAKKEGRNTYAINECQI